MRDNVVAVASVGRVVLLKKKDGKRSKRVGERAAKFNFAPPVGKFIDPALEITHAFLNSRVK